MQKYTVPLPKADNVKEVKLDLRSCDLYPNDAPKGYLPRNTTADGNCLYNAASQLTWGSDHYHRELRVRNSVELALNEDKYLDDSFLRRGLRDHDSTHIGKYYAQYLDHYTMTKLTNKEIQRLFMCV